MRDIDLVSSRTNNHGMILVAYVNGVCPRWGDFNKLVGER